MSSRTIETEDHLDWYGPETPPEFSDLCLVRMVDGELRLAYGKDVIGLSDVSLWCIVPPPRQYIKQK